MRDYHVKKTLNTPEVNLKSSEGVLRMEGRAIPEDPGQFFDEVLEHLTEYYNSPQPVTKCEFKLEYINSGSSKYLMDIFRFIKNNYDSGNNCHITWFFEEDDESIQELGLHYQNTIKVPFKLVDYY